MATSIISTTGGASTPFTVRGNSPVELAIAPSAWEGVAWWQRLIGQQWQNIRQVGVAETITVDADGTYRVWAQVYTAGSLSVTDTQTGQVDVHHVEAVSEAEYEAAEDPDPNTLYVIVESGTPERGVAVNSREVMAGQTGASQVGFQQDGTGAVPRTLQDKGREVVSITDFGATSGGPDCASAVNAAAVAALASGRTLFIPGGSWHVHESVSVKCSVRCEGEVVLSGSGSPQFAIDRAATPVVLTPGALSGLTRGSNVIGGITGNEWGTLKLSSTEELIKRFGSADVYLKSDVQRLVDAAGAISPELDCTYVSTANLTATVYPAEAPLTIDGLRVRVSRPSGAVASVRVTRSDVTLNDFTLSVDSAQRTSAQIGVHVTNSVNVVFNRPVISGVLHTAGPSQLGYGILAEHSSDIVINNGSMSLCKHCVAGRSNKTTRIVGGSYASVGGSPIDTHWGNVFSVTGSLLDCGGYSGVLFAGTDVRVKDCTIRRSIGIIEFRQDTPEIMGVVNCSGNFIETTGAGLSFLVGSSSAGGNYASFFGRELEQPAAIEIRSNRARKMNSGDLILLRGWTVAWSRTQVRSILIEDNLDVSGTGFNKIVDTGAGNWSPFCVDPLVTANYDPAITINRQPLTNAILFISSNNAGSVTYKYNSRVIDCDTISLRSDVDASRALLVRNSTVRDIRCCQNVATVKTVAFDHDLQDCTFDPSGFLYQSSAKLRLRGCGFSANLGYGTDAPAPVIHSTRKEATVFTRGNMAAAGVAQSFLPHLDDAQDTAVFGRQYSGSATYDPPSLADGAGATTTVTVDGAQLGDYAAASFSLDLSGITLTAYVSSNNIVTVRFQNESGGVLDLASGTLRARAFKS